MENHGKTVILLVKMVILLGKIVILLGKMMISIKEHGDSMVS